MTITLTWDLFIIVFFALVVAYSFIIGKHESVKIVFATYVAVVAVQGVGNLLERFSGQSDAWLSMFGFGLDATMLATVKVVVFVAAVIVFAVRSGLEVEYGKEPGGATNAVLTGLFGFATAGLLLSTLTTFIAGVAILDAGVRTSVALVPFLAQSQLLQILVNYQDIWFALPALLILVVGFVSQE